MDQLPVTIKLTLTLGDWDYLIHILSKDGDKWSEFNNDIENKVTSTLNDNYQSDREKNVERNSDDELYYKEIARNVRHEAARIAITSPTKEQAHRDIMNIQFKNIKP